MDRVLIALAIVVVAAAIAFVQRRRRPDAPTQPNHEAPAQLDRSDFPHVERDWLLVVFTSSTCHTCADVARKAQAAESRFVGVTEIEYTTHRALHERYAITAVPTLVLTDRSGVVHAAFLGPVSATDLWAAIAEAREPGTRPAPCGEHVHDGGPDDSDGTGG